MTVLTALLIALTGMVAIYDMLLLLLFRFNVKPLKRGQERPEGYDVAILVAARNEAEHLPYCLESLIVQDYPIEKIQIWIGNDASSDNTLSIAKDYASRYSFVKVRDISSNLPNLMGKANVLAQLARCADAELYFITDADMVLPTTWLKTMVSQLGPKVGVVTGVTVVKDAVYQCMEWLSAMGMIKVGTDTGLGTTAMGNNMLITKTAYDKVGGYERLPFSITEDLALSQAVIKSGYSAAHILHQEVLGVSVPAKGFLGLMQQRKRWIKGALDLPFPLVFFLFVKTYFLPLLMVLAVAYPRMSLALFLIRIFWQSLLLYSLKKKFVLPCRLTHMHILSFGIYDAFLSAIVGVFFLLPIKVVWKGRAY